MNNTPETPVPSDRIDSTDDARTHNSGSDVRDTYRVLSDDEKAAMSAIKQRGRDFLDELTEHFGRLPGGSYSSRELNLARTKIEEAVMWAVKHLTQ